MRTLSERCWVGAWGVGACKCVKGAVMYGETDGSGEEVLFDGLWRTTIGSQWKILRGFRISVKDLWKTEKLLITEISDGAKDD